MLWDSVLCGAVAGWERLGRLASVGVDCGGENDKKVGVMTTEFIKCCGMRAVNLKQHVGVSVIGVFVMFSAETGSQMSVMMKMFCPVFFLVG